MSLVFAIAVILAVIFSIGYRFGWNAACRLYRDRAVDSADSRYAQDKR